MMQVKNGVTTQKWKNKRKEEEERKKEWSTLKSVKSGTT